MRAGPQEIRSELHLSKKFKRYFAVLGPTSNYFRQSLPELLSLA